eukprot:Opistho-2@11993
MGCAPSKSNAIDPAASWNAPTTQVVQASGVTILVPQASVPVPAVGPPPVPITVGSAQAYNPPPPAHVVTVPHVPMPVEGGPIVQYAGDIPRPPSTHSARGSITGIESYPPAQATQQQRPPSTHSRRSDGQNSLGTDGMPPRGASRSSLAGKGSRLEECAKLEARILDLESRNISSDYSVAQARVAHYDRQLAAAAERIRELENQAMSEYIDVVRFLGPSTETAMVHLSGHAQQQFEREQWEYVTALNRLEIAKHETDKLVAARTQLAQDMQAMWLDMGQLRQLYEAQDSLLGRFNGVVQPDGCPYSTAEWRMEMESEQLAETVSFVARAKCQWDTVFLLLSSAHGYLDDAARHLESAQIAPSHGPIAAARSLVADAVADMSLALSYIPVENLPGLTTANIDQLNGLTISIFQHYFDPAVLRADAETISAASASVFTAMQWAGNMIRDVIVPDVQKAEERYVRKREKLMEERRNVVARAETQASLGAELSARTGSVLSMNLARDDDGDLARAGSSMSMREEFDAQSDSRRGSQQTVLPPKPTREQLYGDIEGLRRRHAEERAELDRAKETNKARQEVALREKLVQKRLKRIMVEAEQTGSPKARSKATV